MFQSQGPVDNRQVSCALHPIARPYLTLTCSCVCVWACYCLYDMTSLPRRARGETVDVLSTAQCAELHVFARRLRAHERVNHCLPLWLDVFVKRKRELIPDLATALVAEAERGVGNG
jgi:hypothetical protein